MHKKNEQLNEQTTLTLPTEPGIGSKENLTAPLEPEMNSKK
jgi:hypothetical protein